MLKVIPNTKHSLGMNDKGYIFDLRTKEIRNMNSPNYDISEFWGSEYKNAPLKLIQAVTLLNIKLPLKYYKYIDVRFKEDQVELLRSIWYCFSKPIEAEEEGFFVIPYYTSHAINSRGDIFDVDTGVIRFNNKKPNYDPTSIYTNAPNVICDFRITQFGKGVIKGDIKAGTVLHRLLALAFCKYDDNPYFLEVNHIDGKKGNFNISNLEWVTRQQNFIHALYTGLRDDCIPVVVRDWIEEKDIIFPSISEASRYILREALRIGIDINESIVNERCILRQHNLCAGRYSVQYYQNDYEWEYSNFSEAISKSQFNLIEVFDVINNTKKVFLGILSTYDYVKESINRCMISFIINKQYLEGKLYIPFNGFMFRYLDQPEFPVFTDLEISLFKRLKDEKLGYSKRNIRKIFKNGKLIKIAVNWEDVMETTGINLNNYRRLTKGEISSYTDSNNNTWKLEHYPLLIN